MKDTHITKLKKEKAILISVSEKRVDDNIVNEHLSELSFLAETAGIKVVTSFKQKLERPDIRTFVGKGKLEEIRAFVKKEKIQVLIFDDDLTPSQLRNIERELELKIYDRSLLILDIFLQRAQSAQAKTQVELARYQYLMPRLTNMWTHLERQRGGTGTRGGAGEKEIETDKRQIRNQISVLKGKLEKIEKQNFVQRKSRGNTVRVALVGYTNVGKSTIMTLLSKSHVMAENKLFATVDATVRKVVFNTIPFLLSDTVGFIRKLPHHLIESFKSTLAEVKEADILLHVVDVAHPAFEDQIEVVRETLRDIGAADKPTIYVFNKLDLLLNNEDSEMELEGIKEFYKSLKDKDKDVVFISAENKLNLDEFKELIYRKVKKRHLTIFPNYLKNETY